MYSIKSAASSILSTWSGKISRRCETANLNERSVNVKNIFDRRDEFTRKWDDTSIVEMSETANVDIVLMGFEILPQEDKPHGPSNPERSKQFPKRTISLDRPLHSSYTT